MSVPPFRWTNYRNWLIIFSLALESVQLILSPIQALQVYDGPHNVPHNSTAANTTRLPGAMNVIYLSFVEYSFDVTFWASVGAAVVVVLCVIVQAITDTYTYAVRQEATDTPAPEQTPEEMKPSPAPPPPAPSREQDNEDALAVTLRYSESMMVHAQDCLDKLQEQSETLSVQSQQFYKKATQLRRRQRLFFCFCCAHCVSSLVSAIFGDGKSIDNVFGDLEYTSTRGGRCLRWAARLPLLAAVLVAPLVFFLNVAGVLLLALPALFWLLLLRTTKVETSAVAMTERLDVMEAEVVTRSLLRWVSTALRSLPLAFLLMGSPWVFFLVVLPNVTTEGIDYAFIAGYLAVVAVLQVLGTIRAIAAHDALRAHPIVIPVTPEQHFHQSFFGSLIYGHGTVVGARKTVVTLVSLFGDTLFFNVIANVLLTVTCFSSVPWKGAYTSHIQSATGDLCFDTEYERIRAAAGLCAFGVYVPICVMLTPSLSESDPDLKDIHFAKHHTMTVGAVKVLVIVSMLLLPDPGMFLAVIGFFYAIVAAQTLHRFVSFGEPADRPVASLVRVNTFGCSALACSIALVWHGAGRSSVDGAQGPLYAATMGASLLWAIVMAIWYRNA